MQIQRDNFFERICGYFPFQLIVLWAGLAGVFRYSNDLMLFITSLAILTHFFPAKRIYLLVIGSILSLGIFDFQFYVIQHNEPGSLLYYWINKAGYVSLNDASGILFRMLVATTTLVPLYFLVQMVSVRRLFTKMWFWIPFYLLLLCILSYLRETFTPISFFIVAVIIMMSGLVLIVPFYLKSIPDHEKIGIKSLLSVMPFFSRELVSTWNMPVDQKKNHERFLSLRVSSTKYMIFLVALFLVGDKVRILFYSGHFLSLDAFSPVFNGLSGGVYLSNSRAELWLSTLLNGLFFIWLKLACGLGIHVAIARFFGIEAHRPVYKPYLAVSFADFMNRILFYYNQMIVHLFFFPIYDSLRFLRKQKELRKALSILLAVIIGGFAFHFFRDRHLIIMNGIKEALVTYGSSHVLYIGCIAIASCIPTARIAHKNIFLRVAVLVYVYVLYCLILILSLNYSKENFGAKLEFFKYLFALN